MQITRRLIEGADAEGGEEAPRITRAEGKSTLCPEPSWRRGVRASSAGFAIFCHTINSSVWLLYIANGRS